MDLSRWYSEMRRCWQITRIEPSYKGLANFAVSIQTCFSSSLDSQFFEFLIKARIPYLSIGCNFRLQVGTAFLKATCDPKLRVPSPFMINRAPYTPLCLGPILGTISSFLLQLFLDWFYSFHPSFQSLRSSDDICRSFLHFHLLS